jgi:hypothetical protein
MKGEPGMIRCVQELQDEEEKLTAEWETDE